MISPNFRAQVDLLLRVLPYVAMEESLALKGGTAINLFAQNMPRLSVDIDLTYLPFSEYDAARKEISDTLHRLQGRLRNAFPPIAATVIAVGGAQEVKLLCRSDDAIVKVEVNTTIRGHLWPTRKLEVVPSAQDEFGKSALANVVSDAELYGGKICAALDRQHPRDLFDIHQLLGHGGITDSIRLGFLAMLLSHSRPIHEVLSPNFQDQSQLFASHFAGMALLPFTYEDFITTREKLVAVIHMQLSADERAFLMSFKQGQPDWSLFPLANLQTMPAVKWKLRNIQQLKQKNAAKHAAQLEALRQTLSG